MNLIVVILSISFPVSYTVKIAMHYYVLMLVTSLLHSATSTVYYVMPDDHYHPINDNTYTLQHYFNNTNKYFTSNTQLHFLPGQYYLNNDLIIQGVSNFSLIGNRTNEVINTVINCTSPAGIAVVGSSNIIIANIVMNECGNDYDSKNQTEDVKTVLVVDSQSITIIYFHSLWSQKLCGFELLNALDSKLSNVVSNYLLIQYIGSNNSVVSTTDTLLIENFQAYSETVDIYTIKIEWHKIYFNFNATILNVKFKNKFALHITCTQCLGNNTVTISNCDFCNDAIGRRMNNEHEYYYDIYECYDHFCDAKIIILLYSVQLENHASENKLYFTDCNFINNSRSRKLLLISIKNNYNTKLPLVTLNNCMFYNNRKAQLLLARCKNGDSKKSCAHISVKNTAVLSNEDFFGDMIDIYHVILTLENVKIINNSLTGSRYASFSKSFTCIIIKAENSYLKYKGYNEFSMNTAHCIIMSSEIHMCENSILNFSSNTLSFNVEIFSLQNDDEIDTCAIQYISEQGNLDKEFQMGKALNYSIIHNNNNELCEISYTDLYHCEWDSTSAFWTSSPLHVNQHFIHQNISMIKQNICLCKKNKTRDCYVEELGSFYPGVTVSFNFIVYWDSADSETLLLQQNDDSYFACRGKKSVIVESGKCEHLNITLIHESGTWCELYLTALLIYPSVGIGQRIMYTIILLPCPRGFSLHTGECVCDTTLSYYIRSLTHCNIDDQTIPRPANSWISAHTVNNSHSYHVSLNCPFDYCLPHSSHLNLSTLDSQCQFNRSGLLCGQCQQGLSAVFGSSQCKQCSNVYLLIIIPIGIAGVILVLLLFILNLTVTDGDVNAFLLYVNIISINSSIFIQNNGPGKATRTFISLANLDLGIPTCFYNGMDNYAKAWLQLMFPAYLILIATSLIIASRYSGRIQRLTARRALPVLATLFLLSYTKVLLLVSSVLFFYSTTTHLPSNKTTVLWLVDPNVPVFEAKFTILFVVCFILFLVLISFNMILTFTRTIARFKIINHFKPLLDAYQGPYKIKFYYWTGLQLLIRAIFFGLSALDKSLNIMLSILLLGTLLWLNEKLSPYKRKGNALMEKLFLLNLFVMFVINISQYDTINNIMISVLISLAMLQLLCIVILHFKTLLIETFPKCEIVFDFNRVSLQVSKYFRNFKGREGPRHDLELTNPVPEKTYNYEEFQEPLVAI